MTSMEDDLNGRLPQWKMIQAKNTFIKEYLNRRQRQWNTSSLEDDLNGRRPKWKMTSIKYNLNLDDLHGR